ncbi:ion transporter [Amedibacillus sp. YH-ame10]
MRERIYTLIEKAHDHDPLSKAYDWYIMLIACVSVVPLMFRTSNNILNTIETITVYLLFLDYILRWITHDYRVKKHSPWAFIMYPITPFAIMDILSILPSIGLLPKSFMILRLLRLTKVIHYSRSFQHVVNVFKNERKTLLSVLLIAVFYIIVSALIMFVYEPKSTFGNFFDALYWATTALTTVGYGDVFPHTDVGKLISMISSLFGVAVIAMPAGIVTGGFLEEIHRDIEEREQRKLERKKQKEEEHNGKA